MGCIGGVCVCVFITSVFAWVCLCVCVHGGGGVISCDTIQMPVRAMGTS